MSTTIDSKVVEMRFDNKHFETNTRQTMSTLDKLKQKLNLTGASKGLENINTSANKVNMSGMSNALDTVHSKFSALEIMGTTALVNITNSAVNAGKRIVSALTIGPVSDGWSEYEMVLNAIQTTMAGTGKTAEEVQKELEKLDVYADKTVYSTSDMLNNLPKFTNAGVELEKATTAMIGIANATALAGGDAGKASIAFYNLGQAIGTGYLTRMDYNSINNAGIATMEWKNQMVEAAIAAGTLKKVGEDSYQAGNKTLTLQQLFIDGLQEQWATTDVMMKVFGDYGDETTEIGKKSYAAAQDIKTFSMMMDSLKATAGTGWKETWQIIFGDLEEAKKFWTGLSNFISKIITGMADFRNNLLEKALGSPLGKFKKTFDSITKPIKETVDTVNNALEDLDKMVNEVIRGNWGNGIDRFNKLTEAGHNYYAIQNKVNETLGCSFRYSDELVNSQKTLNKSQEETNTLEKGSLKTKEELLIQLAKMSEAELEAAGYTKEQIEAIKELKKYAKMTGLSIEDLVANIDEFSGRWLLINSFKNIGQGLVAVFKAIGDAWAETVGFLQPETLFRLIAAFHKFTTYLTVSDRAAQNLKDTFKGLFSFIDLLLTIIGGPIKIGLKLLGQLFKALDITAGGVLELTGGVGRAVTSFNNWLNSLIDFTPVFEFLAPHIRNAAHAVKEWFKSIGQSEAVKKFTEFLRKSKDAIVDWFKGLKETDNIAKYIFEGLFNGLVNGAKGVITFVMELGKQIIASIKNVLGIHSPSTEFYEIGKNIVQGLFNGIGDFVKMVYNLIMTVGRKIIDIIKNLDIGSIFTIAMGAGITFAFIKIGKAIASLAAPLQGLGNLMFEAGETLQVFQGTLKSFSLKVKAEAIKSIAIAIAILAGSIAVLSMIDPARMWSAVGAIVVLMGLLAGLTAIAGKFGGEKGLEFGKIALTLIGLGIAMALMASALKKISKIDSDKAVQSIIGFIAIVSAMLLMMKVLGSSSIISKDGKSNMAKLGGTFIGLSVALLIMANVVKILGKMDEKVLKQGLVCIVAFGLIITGLMAATRLLGEKNIDHVGKSIFKIAGAILIMTLVAKMLGKMDRKVLVQGTLAIVAFSAIIVGLMAATKLVTGSKNVDKIGGTILKIAGAILLMAIVARLLGGMETGKLVKGTVAIAAFAGIVVGLIAATKLVSGKDLTKVGTTILMVTVAIGLMALTAALLSLMSIEALAKGIIAVGILSGLMMGLIAVTKYAKNVKGTLIVITVAIGILVAAVALLSLIDTGKLMASSAALSLVLGMFALVIKATGKAKKVMSTLIVLTTAIALVAGALYLLAQLPAAQTLSSAGALSLVMGTLAAVMLTTSSVAKMGKKDVIVGLAGILALVGMLYLIVDVLKRMNGIENASQNAIVLAAFMGALAIVQLLCAAAGAIYAATGTVAMLGLVGMVALIATLYLVIGALALMENLPNAITNLTVLTNFMMIMSDLLLKLAIIGPLALIGVTAMAALSILMVAMGTLAVGIGALMQKFPQIKSFLDTGIPVFIQLAGGIGEMIGAFVNGILTQISSGLPEIGMNLGLFMTNATPFIMGAKLVDESVLKGIGILTGAILALTAAEIIEGIASFLSGGNSFSELGTELSLFMINAMPFITLSRQLDPAIMEGVKSLADAILTITATDILDSLTSWLTGGNSLADFGAQLGDLGGSLNTFVSRLGVFTPEQASTVSCACDAIKSLANAANEIPGTDGLWQKIAGEKSLAAFADDLPNVGEAITGFIGKLGTFGDDQLKTVDVAGQAITALANSANEIPAKDGLWQVIAGEKSLAEFADDLPNVGRALNGFITELGTFGDDQLKTVDVAGQAIKALADAGSKVPETGGLKQLFTGENDISSFANKFPIVGMGLKLFIQNIGEFTTQQLDTVYAAVSALYAICSLGGLNVENANSVVLVFTTFLGKIVSGIKEFVNGLGDLTVESIDAAVEKVYKLTDMLKNVAGENIEGLDTFGNSLRDVAKDIVKGFCKEFSDEDPKAKAKKAISEMIDALIDGAESKKSEVTKSFKATAKEAIKALDDKSFKNSAESAGKDICQGLINGLKNTDKRTAVYNAAFSLGQLAVKGEKDGQESNSPSKATEKAGKWLGEGLINGIKNIGGKVYNAGRTMGEEATNSISNALNSVMNLLDNDMDTEPTIRPVLDLSDVESGVGYLSSMLNNGPSLAVAANLGAISSGMNARNQNGVNADVVSAIDDLRKDLGNMNGDTYNVNGVTYDDGSNITEAVKAIVRAAKVERRI